MTTVLGIYDGMLGTHAIDTIQMIPIFSTPNNGLGKPITTLAHGTIKKQPDCMNTAVIQPNTSGARGVKPCKGNLDAVRVLRKAPLPYQQALYPQTGFARHQKKGLAYDPQKPINQPLMPLADNFNAGLNSRLPQPK
jgi:hypothetical protein